MSKNLVAKLVDKVDDSLVDKIKEEANVLNELKPKIESKKKKPAKALDHEDMFGDMNILYFSMYYFNHT
jgi:hypothetical protein